MRRRRIIQAFAFSRRSPRDGRWYDTNEPWAQERPTPLHRGAVPAEAETQSMVAADAAKLTISGNAALPGAGDAVIGLSAE